MKQAILLLGSNLDNRLDYLRKGIKLLKNKEVEVLSVSSVYESPAFGYSSTNNYYNLAVTVCFTSTPLHLLEHCLAVEDKLNRTRNSEVRYSDRTIDIDVILIDDEIIETKKLTVPHPRMHERLFCLKPVQEIASNWIIPTFGVTVKKALNNLKETSLVTKLDVEI